MITCTHCRTCMSESCHWMSCTYHTIFWRIIRNYYFHQFVFSSEKKSCLLLQLVMADTLLPAASIESRWASWWVFRWVWRVGPSLAASIVWGNYRTFDAALNFVLQARDTVCFSLLRFTSWFLYYLLRTDRAYNILLRYIFLLIAELFDRMKSHVIVWNILCDQFVYLVFNLRNFIWLHMYFDGSLQECYNYKKLIWENQMKKLTELW